MEYISEVLSFLAGLGTGFGLKFVIDRSKKVSINQTANRVGGDMAGRDISKK